MGEPSGKALSVMRSVDGELIAANVYLSTAERPDDEPFWPAPWLPEVRALPNPIDGCSVAGYTEPGPGGWTFPEYLKTPLNVSICGAPVSIPNNGIAVIGDFEVGVTDVQVAPPGGTTTSQRAWMFSLILVSRRFLGQIP